MSEKITCVYVVALLVLSCCGSIVSAACPVTVVPASVTLTDLEVQGASGRARIQMLNLLVDVRPINGSTTVDTSAGLVAAPRTTGYEPSGLAGGESPQGFFLRFLPRLNGMIRYASVIQLELIYLNTSDPTALAPLFTPMDQRPVSKKDFTEVRFIQPLAPLPVSPKPRANQT
jgi:hypothetical protein